LSPDREIAEAHPQAKVKNCISKLVQFFLNCMKTSFIFNCVSFRRQQQRRRLGGSACTRSRTTHNAIKTVSTKVDPSKVFAAEIASKVTTKVYQEGIVLLEP
jgi:hypothetical protein